jgi:hypothetical protein
MNEQARTRKPRQGRKLLLGFVGALMATLMVVGGVAAKSHSLEFDMVRSSASLAANCLPKAKAEVQITSIGPVEIMDVEASGLPAKTNFDFFVTQLPNAPFGVAWYQGDIETDKNGEAHQKFIGRFNIETFVVAPGSGPAPLVFDTDASSNPAFNPIQMYHLGLWFNSPKEAQAAGCSGAVTPFNGEHNAGPQALSTRNFKDDHGPLRQLKP